jgi:hypothetical protein
LSKKKGRKKNKLAQEKLVGVGRMGEKSWEYVGESKGWHNVFDHRWIRSEFIPGWSAAEGGPGPSSHQREDLTQTRLRPGCGEAVFLDVCLQIDVSNI